MELVHNKAKVLPDVQVTTKETRRRFMPEYKLRILKEADECAKLGELGALLRREGLYSSHLSDWRRSQEHGELLRPPKRGRPAKSHAREAKRIAELERQLAKALARAEHAEALVDLQKKVAALLGRPLRGDKP
jgi:transposase-like protein